MTAPRIIKDCVSLDNLVGPEWSYFSWLVPTVIASPNDDILFYSVRGKPGVGGSLYQLDVASGKRKTFLSPDSNANCLQGVITHLLWSRDGLLLSGDTSGHVKGFDPETGKCLFNIKAHAFGVRGMALLPEGRLATAGLEEVPEILELGLFGRRRTRTSLRLWNLDSQTLEGVLEERCLDPHSSVASTGQTLVSATEGGRVGIWKSFNPPPSRSFLQALLRASGCSKLSLGRVTCLHATSDKLLVASGFSVTRFVFGRPQFDVRVYDLAGKPLGRLRGHEHEVVCMESLSADGSTVATGSLDGTIRIWDVSTGQCRCILSAHSPVRAISGFSDGRRLVSVSWDDEIRLWDLHEAGDAPSPFMERESVGRCR